MSDDTLRDRLIIRELIEDWAVARDAGDWERFRSVWHADGQMQATWWQGPFEEFINASRAGMAAGAQVLHFLGGSSIEVGGERAIAQTKMTITQRSEIDGVACDVICTGRFYDFLEKRTGRWGLVLRQPIYEQDRIAQVAPGRRPVLDQAILSQFPVGYRHLAYLQTSLGYAVKRNMPGLTGEAVERLLDNGAAWLSGVSPVHWRLTPPIDDARTGSERNEQ
jgi:hypothetical protein